MKCEMCNREANFKQWTKLWGDIYFCSVDCHVTAKKKWGLYSGLELERLK